MSEIKVLPFDSIGKNFIPKEYLPNGKDEYYLRNIQINRPFNRWRHLMSNEVETLIKNNNTSDNWDDILVTDLFNPDLIKNSDFYGLVRIGNTNKAILEHHNLKVPVGITDSVIISCDIGDDSAIHSVRYMSHYIIGDNCILFNINELHSSNYAKFGNGIVKDGESENVRVWLHLMNETGCRKVIPFDGMISADAYLWAKYRDDKLLQDKLKEITQNSFDHCRGYYGVIGNQCVIKNSRIIKDVRVGSNCYIKGANKLKNLTINSSKAEPAQIGEGVEIVNGIIGYGCHIFYGVKAVRFIMGNNSNLKYGARLINSFLGDNSTISCCEVQNNLIFPAHEQHHNNSFLIASVLMGQSNIAAGATIGSNHNSRANDNEIQAGRGFWPGLCTSVKHSCRFASFVLLSKSDYPFELDIPFPFSLISNNYSKDELEVMPAYWWLYNMYALARNTWKFTDRDKREKKIQHIEFDSLAPDTIEEIFNARKLIEIWTAKAYFKSQGKKVDEQNENELTRIGRKILNGKEADLKKLEVFGEMIEKSLRKVRILKFYQAYHAYGDMIHYYGVKNLLAFSKINTSSTLSGMSKTLKSTRVREWVNLGGQLIRQKDVDELRSDIGSGKLTSWQDIHNRYDLLWHNYTLDKQKHAFASLCDIIGLDTLTADNWISALDKAVQIQIYICKQVYLSRKKDMDNPFRMITFRNEAEMIASIGKLEDNSFIKQVNQETNDFTKLVEEIKKRG